MPARTADHVGEDDGAEEPKYTDEAYQMGINFKVKYVGTLDISKPVCRGDIVSAMRNVRNDFKIKGILKLKVNMAVSIHGIKVSLRKRCSKNDWVWDESNLVMFFSPIYKIFYVSHDSLDLKIFSYICRDQATKEFKCNVFKSHRKSQAMKIVKTIGNAFEVSRTLGQHHKGLQVDSIFDSRMMSCAASEPQISVIDAGAGSTGDRVFIEAIQARPQKRVLGYDYLTSLNESRNHPKISPKQDLDTVPVVYAPCSTFSVNNACPGGRNRSGSWDKDQPGAPVALLTQSAVDINDVQGMSKAKGQAGCLTNVNSCRVVSLNSANHQRTDMPLNNSAIFSYDVVPCTSVPKKHSGATSLKIQPAPLDSLLSQRKPSSDCPRDTLLAICDGNGQYIPDDQVTVLKRLLSNERCKYKACMNEANMLKERMKAETSLRIESQNRYKALLADNKELKSRFDVLYKIVKELRSKLGPVERHILHQVRENEVSPSMDGHSVTLSQSTDSQSQFSFYRDNMRAMNCALANPAVRCHSDGQSSLYLSEIPSLECKQFPRSASGGLHFMFDERDFHIKTAGVGSDVDSEDSGVPKQSDEGKVFNE